jgi:predicted acyltransferase
MLTATAQQRLSSLDQFRGYSVAGMFVVNFLGGLAVTHHVLKHNNTHFSYADSIMPSFIFACGFSYRMSFLKRQQQVGAPSPIRRRFVLRSLGLILLSLMLFGFNQDFLHWSEISLSSLGEFFANLWKANLWEVLAIIGAIQILCLPFIGRGSSTRILAWIGLGALHVLLSWSFNYDFVYGRENWLDTYWGATGKRAWDGGFWGLLPWSQVLLAGTLAYDMTQVVSPSTAARRLLGWGVICMLLGYGLSCLTRLYDIDTPSPLSPSTHVASAAARTTPPLSQSPVLPNWSQARGRNWSQLLAEPPFVPPASASERQLNYWMMDKRIVSQSFVFFSTGFALALYGLFMIFCDVQHFSSSLFRTFGQNPLAAYIINHFVNDSVLQLVPKDSPVAWVLLGLSVAFGITYVFVRFLEQRGLFLRL